MRYPRGFTLIELLVVISIIALLIGILLPVLGAVRETARALKSMSNTRQWALGTYNFTVDNKGEVPWEGPKQPDSSLWSSWLSGNPSEEVRWWWGHAIPPYLNQRSYLDLSVPGDPESPPLPPENSIFIDPSVDRGDAPWDEGTFGFYYFFCYVPSAELNNQFSSVNDYEERINVDQIAEASSTVFIYELRITDDELPEGDPYRRGDDILRRARGDGKHFAARHDDGGHMAFLDGHAEHLRFQYVVEDPDGDGDWNRLGDLIWDPLGPTDLSP